MSCPGGAFVGCTPTNGTPIAVATATNTAGIDFDLVLGPTGDITGTVIDSVSGSPLSSIEVEVFDSNGFFLDSGFTNGAGVYTVTGLPTGNVFARTDNFQGYLDELFDDLTCFFGCTPTSGTAIAVMTGVTTPGIDFALDPGGSVSGNITDSVSGLPISGIEVEIWDMGGSFLGSNSSDGQGDYMVSGLPGGNVFATTSNFQGYLDELYDDLPCPGGAYSGCIPTSGDPIAVVVAMDTPGIDFDLDPVPTGGISGTLTDSVTGFPLLGVEVEVFNPGGGFEGSGFTDSAGDYTVSGLPIGTVFARTDNFQGYLDELYDDLPCFSGCTPTSGTAIAVMTGVTTPGIDFVLDPGGTISGVVLDSGTGLPISGIEVEIWDSGEFFAGSDFTDGAGVYAVSGLKAETHFATTINFQGYNDELYDDMACPGGAFAGCAPAAGTPIAVMAATTTAGIDFDLVLQPTGSISGTIMDGDTGLPLSGIEVKYSTAAGSLSIMISPTGLDSTPFQGCPRGPSSPEPTTSSPIWMNSTRTLPVFPGAVSLAELRLE